MSTDTFAREIELKVHALVRARVDEHLQGITMPLLTQKEFAKAIGVTNHVVTGWVTHGYIKTVKIGKYSLVNIECLREICKKQKSTKISIGQEI